MKVETLSDNVRVKFWLLAKAVFYLPASVKSLMKTLRLRIFVIEPSQQVYMPSQLNI